MPASRGAPTQIAPRTERWLPHALIATAFVVVLPALAVWMIVPRGEAALLALSVPLGMLLSVLAGSLGGALWKRVPGSRDIVFADLMIWGWLRRLRAERRLARAETLLGDGAGGLSVQALSSLSALLEARDTFTYGHSQRVTRHAERIARAMGLSTAEVARVRTAAALHDVGKLQTPRDILNKPGRLTADEFEVIRRHPSDGAAMADGLGDPLVTAIIRHHHERLDGDGYPDGLAGEAIPLGARIIAVADTFDAMTSNRAYRRAASHKHALDVLRKEAGTQLDGDAVAAFDGYYRGRRTVAWSAFATAAPQRLCAWLGGISPGVTAGAAALAIGVAGPPPPAVTPAAAASRHAVGHAATAAGAPLHAGPARRPTHGDAPPSRERRSARRDAGRSPGKRSRPRSTKRRRDTPGKKLAARGNGQAAKPPKLDKVTAEKVKPDKVTPDQAKPVKVKPDKAKPVKAKPDKVKPQPVKPEKVKPPKVPPEAKPPKVPPEAKPPKVPPPATAPDPAAPSTAKPPKPTKP